MPKQGLPRQSRPVSPRYPVRSFPTIPLTVKRLGRNKAIFPVSPPAPARTHGRHVDGVAAQKAEPLTREAYAASPPPGEFLKSFVGFPNLFIKLTFWR